MLKNPQKKSLFLVFKIVSLRGAGLGYGAARRGTPRHLKLKKRAKQGKTLTESFQLISTNKTNPTFKNVFQIS